MTQCRQGVVGKKTRKLSHQASRGLSHSSEDERQDILNLYTKIKNKGTVQEEEIPFELQGEEKAVDLGGFIEGIRTSSPEIQQDALKRLAHIADIQNIDLAKILPSVTQLVIFSPHEDVRYEATKVIARTKAPEVASILTDVINREESHRVKAGAVKGLGIAKSNRSMSDLIFILSDVWNEVTRVRKAAAFALGRLEADGVIGALCDSLVNDPDVSVRIESAESIAMCLLKMEKNKAISIFQTISSQIQVESESDHRVRAAVIDAMIVAENDACIDGLIVALKNDPEGKVRGKAAHGLAHYFDPRIERALVESLDRETNGVKKRIALALAHYAMRNPLGLHDEVCDALIEIQKLFPKGSYVWKEAVKALPAC